MAVIEAKHYGEARKRLARDPIVLNMALDIAEGIKAKKVKLEQFTHESGTPRFEFMQAANSQYDKAGRQGPRAHRRCR